MAKSCPKKPGASPTIPAADVLPVFSPDGKQADVDQQPHGRSYEPVVLADFSLPE